MHKPVLTAKRSKPQPLEQRVKIGMARHQFWFDDWRRHPDVHIHCSWCGGSLLIDYFQFGMAEMNRRLMSFVAEHERCEPKEELP